MRYLTTLASFLILLTAACSTGEKTPPHELLTPTPDLAANATYDGLFEGQAVTLVNGRFDDESQRETAGLVGSFSTAGDLDGDGIDDLVVVLWQSSGGSGSYSYLAALLAAADPTAPLRVTLVGDRVKYRSISVRDFKVHLDVLQAGPDDAMCCPGELATRTFAWDADDAALAEEPSNVPTERLSLAAVAGTWRLVDWNLNAPAPDDPEVTLTIQDDQISGSSGCNRYSGKVTESADSPGQISLGPLAGTRRACPEDEMDVESRYLSALAGLERYTFHFGDLALEYDNGDGGVASLLFERKGEDEAVAE